MRAEGAIGAEGETMTTETRKWFALGVAQMYLTHDMAARGWVAGQWATWLNGKPTHLPTLDFGRCVLMFDGNRAILKHPDFLHKFTFADWREAVPFAEEWAGWGDVQ